MKQTIEKVLGNNSRRRWGERVLTLFREQSITIISKLAAPSMTISTILLAIIGVVGERGDPGPSRLSPPKNEGAL